MICLVTCRHMAGNLKSYIGRQFTENIFNTINYEKASFLACCSRFEHSRLYG